MLHEVWFYPLESTKRLSVSRKKYLNYTKRMSLYLQNKSTYNLKFGIVLKLVMFSKTSEKEIWHNIHTMAVVMTHNLRRWNFKNGTWKLIQIQKGQFMYNPDLESIWLYHICLSTRWTQCCQHCDLPAELGYFKGSQLDAISP